MKVLASVFVLAAGVLGQLPANAAGISVSVDPAKVASIEIHARDIKSGISTDRIIIESIERRVRKIYVNDVFAEARMAGYVIGSAHGKPQLALASCKSNPSCAD